MGRIRTIKPEFWTDDVVGSFKIEARLLFIAVWNLADDEGILRWSAPYLKGAVFPYDDEISVQQVGRMMESLTGSGVIFAYSGGRSSQPLAYVVNFHKHQRINRPSPSKLPPPPVSDRRVILMYAERDDMTCHLCGRLCDEKHSENYGSDFLPSPDHLTPVSAGGSDYPSNIRTAHVSCNKGRGNRSVEEYRQVLASGKTAAQLRWPERFTDSLTTNSVNDSLNGSVSDSLLEKEGEGNGKREGVQDSTAQAPRPAQDDRPLLDEAVRRFNVVAEELKLPKVQRLTEPRKASLRKRLVECGGLDGWDFAMARIRASPFLTGSKGWTADFDFVLQPKSFTKLMEGGYDDRGNANALQGALGDLGERIRESDSDPRH